jgi:hypothetical protein
MVMERIDILDIRDRVEPAGTEQRGRLWHLRAGFLMPVGMASVTREFPSQQGANAMIMTHVRQQAFVRSVDDAFLVAAAITCLRVVPVFMLRTHKKKKGTAAPEHAATLE